MFEQILQLIREHDRIMIHRHSSPDGDALGSQIGLKHILRENFPEKEIYAVGDEAGRYSFMADSVMDEVADELYSDALAIILDTSASRLISDDRYAMAKTTARIDHHLFSETIASAEVVSKQVRGSISTAMVVLVIFIISASDLFSDDICASLFSGAMGS